ncbi:hypothetical protein ACWFRB_01750 [Rhodococcus sp. NPDC055112]
MSITTTDYCPTIGHFTATTDTTNTVDGPVTVSYDRSTAGSLFTIELPNCDLILTAEQMHAVLRLVNTTAPTLTAASS